jgi:hypothetical protein
MHNTSAANVATLINASIMVSPLGIAPCRCLIDRSQARKIPGEVLKH